MNDISTAEADARMCWVSKDQKFHAKNEFGSSKNKEKIYFKHRSSVIYLKASIMGPKEIFDMSLLLNLSLSSTTLQSTKQLALLKKKA